MLLVTCPGRAVNAPFRWRTAIIYAVDWPQPSTVMKTILELKALLVASIIAANYGALGQANDQTAQPTSPRDRIAPADEKTKGDQPITLRISGANLRDDSGASIGRVEDLIIDPQTGRIEFLIVSAFYPTNSIKLLPIPWKAITYRSSQSGMGKVPGGNQVFALNYPRTKLKDAPTFQRYRWPDMSESSWRQPIYKHYGATAGGGAGSDTQTATGSGTSTDPNDPTARKIAPSFDANFIGPRLPDPGPRNERP